VERAKSIPNAVKPGLEKSLFFKVKKLNYFDLNQIYFFKLSVVFANIFI